MHLCEVKLSLCAHASGKRSILSDVAKSLSMVNVNLAVDAVCDLVLANLSVSYSANTFRFV
jgi:hypothetical protein